MKMFILGIIVGLALIDIASSIAQYFDPMDLGNPMFDIPGGLLDPSDGAIMPHVPQTPNNLHFNNPSMPCY